MQGSPPFSPTAGCATIRLYCLPQNGLPGTRCYGETVRIFAHVQVHIYALCIYVCTKKQACALDLGLRRRGQNEIPCYVAACIQILSKGLIKGVAHHFFPPFYHLSFFFFCYELQCISGSGHVFHLPLLFPKLREASFSKSVDFLRGRPKEKIVTL